jgi:nucleotide-binding universal stress UspA family protein
MDAQVTLLHVISDPMYYSSLDYSPIMGFAGYINNDPLQLNTMEVMKSASLNFLGKTRIHLVDPNVQIMVEEGEVAETILRTAKKIHADIVVIGSHSRKWLENIVMGSVSGEVLNHTTIPVQIIPTKKHN